MIASLRRSSPLRGPHPQPTIALGRGLGAAWGGALLALGALGCATSGGQSSFDGGASTTPLVTGSNSTSSGATPIITGGTGFGSDSGVGAISSSSSSGTDGGGHGMRCNDAGQCTCIAIASIGHEGVWGPCSSDTTTALQNWLNTQSTAKVDNYDTVKPTLTADFLSQYDVIVLQWMVANGQQDNDGNPWQFSSDEIMALQNWVQNGGGIVALSGYQGTSPSAVEDIYATNQLLSWTDIQFQDDVLLPTTAEPTNAYCWGGCAVLGGPAGPDAGIMGIGTWNMSTPIGRDVTSVGALDMRSISSTSATVDCSDGTNSYAVHEQFGKGHIVAYGDEWITYSGEWLGMGSCFANDGGAFSNPYDPCYELSPATIFQIPQLWYNMIEYAASSVACFMINNPTIVPITPR